MKISIELNSNSLFNIVLKQGKTTKRLFNFSNTTEAYLKYFRVDSDLKELINSEIKRMKDFKLNSVQFENRKLKFI